MSLSLIVNGQFVETIDGIETVFTVPYTIANPAQFYFFGGTPAELITTGYTLVGQQVTFDTAPTAGFSRYYTSDSLADPGVAEFGVALTPTGTPDGEGRYTTWLFPQAIKDEDSAEIYYPSPGALIYRVDSSPGPSEYTLAGDLTTVTLGSPLHGSEPLTATVLWPTVSTATLSSATCESEALYLEARASAAAAFAEFGAQAMVLTSRDIQGKDTSTGQVTVIDTDTTFSGLLLDPEQTDIDGETVQIGDKKILAVLTTVVPKVRDTLTIGMNSMTIRRVSSVSPGCIPIFYKMFARGPA